MIFSFEMDTLEVGLKEQQDFVDKIFLVEASASHKGVSDLVVHALSQAEGSCLMVYNNYTITCLFLPEFSIDRKLNRPNNC